jgi:hypothetical protein
MCLDCVLRESEDQKVEAMRYIKQRLNGLSDDVVLRFAHMIEEVATLNPEEQRCCKSRTEAEELLAGFFWRGMRLKSFAVNAVDEAMKEVLAEVGQHRNQSVH